MSVTAELEGENASASHGSEEAALRSLFEITFLIYSIIYLAFTDLTGTSKQVEGLMLSQEIVPTWMVPLLRCFGNSIPR